MSINDYQNEIITMRANSKRKVVNFLILSLFVLSVVYFTCWLMVITDSFYLDNVGKFLNPLAQFLNPNDTSLSIYKMTSFKLFAMILPCFALYYFIGKQEEKEVESNYEKKVKQRKEIQKQKERLERIKSLNSRGSYSICVSFNYNSSKHIKEETKDKLNQAFLIKIKDEVSKYSSNVNVIQNKAVILYSNDYEKYDYTYSSLLKSIAGLKKIVEDKFSLKITPSITTDSSMTLIPSVTLKNHFAIQDFNFENRAIVSNKFANNYSHLKNKKYVSTPIGEFLSNNSQDAYELNIVHKDLNRLLDNYNKSVI